ncbi:hypothetical protein BC830DRAFT_1170569 [Chytriomyces sp. MP71]|nr:hypothetical protein BC830DRAFT_1170569 [Chytriomyces sp. MP71]
MDAVELGNLAHAPFAMPRSKDDLDWLADDDDNVADMEAADREFSALHRVHGTLGYKDGVDEGRKTSIQSGFDQAYNESFPAAFEKGVESGRDKVRTLLEDRKRNGALPAQQTK